MSNEFLETIKPKSDILNADDLIAGSITIIITAIKVNAKSDQPVRISFNGDNGKPWCPNKSMRRILVIKYGNDSDKFIGKSLTLWRDPTVTWAGKNVGGIVISHMSDMQNDDRFMLTSSQGQKKSYKVEHLIIKASKTHEEIKADKESKASVWARQATTELGELKDVEALQEWNKKNAKSVKALVNYDDATKILNDEIDATTLRLTTERG